MEPAADDLAIKVGPLRAVVLAHDQASAPRVDAERRPGVDLGTEVQLDPRAGRDLALGPPRSGERAAAESLVRDRQARYPRLEEPVAFDGTADELADARHRPGELGREGVRWPVRIQ